MAAALFIRRTCALSILALALAACTALRGADDGPVPERIARLLPADVMLLGEQHDAPEHHAIEHESVQTLVARNQLAALALEMAEEGRSTAALSTAATEAQVQAVLAWDAKAWPWTDYAPTVMAAVRAGVPVLGANLPRARMRDAMADVSLDAQLSEAALSAQQAAVRDGHCGLLPEAQIVPMTRIQIARDRAMAHTLTEQARGPGQVVLLITGAAHADPALGVPQHLPTDLKVRSVRMAAGGSASGRGGFDAVWATPALAAQDYCARLKPPAARTAS
ncbi:MAG: ChaN family lipoprotein [Proteobacteria bacterium]|nr:ChaN family lipoprotein [Pseudomonadota bacterium]